MVGSCYNRSPRPRSSVGQSNRLLSDRSEVRILPRAPNNLLPILPVSIKTVLRRSLRTLVSYIFCIFLFTTIYPVSSASLTGQVFAVHSGDTVILSTSSNQFQKIQLLGIASPPTNTYLGRLSRKFLQMLLAGKFVKVVYQNLTPQGLILGQILHGGDINQRMLETGNARFITSNGMEQRVVDKYVASQKFAQQKGLGMWQKSH